MSPAITRLLLLGLGTAVVPLDSALNIAFPAMTAHFAIPLPRIQWVVICYVLTYGSLMLGVGRLGDIFGHALVFRAGLAWSALAYLLNAAAPSFEWMLLCRVFQGIGAALVISCGPALATGLFPEAQRARALSLYALLFALGSVLGPSLGGLMLDAFGWPAVYWFRTPIALAALVLLRGLPPRREGPREPFDLAGAALLALGIAALLLAVNQARHGWPALGFGALFALAVLGFRRQYRRSARPVLALHHFRLPGFARLNLANALVNLAGFSVLLFVPYYLTGIAGLLAGVGGFVLAASAAGTMAASALAGWLLARAAAPRVAQAGALVVAAGLGAMALWGQGTPLALVVLALALHGAGLGLLQVAYTDIVTATLPRADRGVAGSLAMMTRTIGVVAAASLLTLLFARLAGAPPAFLAGFTPVFALAAALALASALLLRRRSRCRLGTKP